MSEEAALVINGHAFTDKDVATKCWCLLLLEAGAGGGHLCSCQGPQPRTPHQREIYERYINEQLALFRPERPEGEGFREFLKRTES